MQSQTHFVITAKQLFTNLVSFHQNIDSLYSKRVRFGIQTGGEYGHEYQHKHKLSKHQNQLMYFQMLTKGG